ncbi:MAG TPA: hypothetical protein VIT88_03505 [Pyrinomonadaceae bacterium]
MKNYFRSFLFIAVLFLMIIGVGQPQSRAALDKPEFDPACMIACQQLNLECFFGAARKSDQQRCTAEYRRCISHCK